MQDDYQYPIQKLPPIPQIGNQRYQATNIAVTPVEAISAGSFTSPFQDDASATDSGGPSGGSAGGPVTLEYITDETNLVLGTGSAGSSDSTTLNSGATGDSFLNLSTLDPVNATGKGAFYLGANVYQISVQDYRDIETGVSPGDLGQVMLRQLDVCHMGAAGYRSFVCSEAYAP